MVRGGACLFAAVIAAAPVASAETMSFGEAAAMLARGCAADIDANCRGVNLDASRLRECLSRNRDALSSQCRTDFLKSFDAIHKRVAARLSVANACRREIVKLCAGSTRQASKSIPCLTASSTQDVSAQCKGAMSDAGYQ